MANDLKKSGAKPVVVALRSLVRAQIEYAFVKLVLVLTT
jgi:hypothetical protein